MEDKIKETMITEIGKPLLRPIAKIQLVGVCGLLFSPFVLIWDTWQFSGKIALSSICLILIMRFIYEVVSSIVSAKIDEHRKSDSGESNFQQKLNKMAEERKAKQP